MMLFLCSRENLFEDGSHLYRFLDDDPIVSQCHNIPKGIIDVKPKPIIQIESRLRFIMCAILEAYVSEDGKHIDYRSIHGSEEFARFFFSFLFLHFIFHQLTFKCVENCSLCNLCFFSSHIRLC